MLLESRIDSNTIVYLECEQVGGFAKAASAVEFHPDDVIRNVISLSGTMANQLALIMEGAPKHAAVELEFGVKVDSASMVSVSKSPSDGQFRMRIHWKA